ncbi:hypothetical protein [Streptomyces sp. NPDC093591]|uniref:hypothetical protein n=1 Tax=Streptomyces sp. NPDC093591 TaxID=3366044 RepID=UPI003813907A
MTRATGTHKGSVEVGSTRLDDLGEHADFLVGVVRYVGVVTDERSRFLLVGEMRVLLQENRRRYAISAASTIPSSVVQLRVPPTTIPNAGTALPSPFLVRRKPSFSAGSSGS